MKPLSVTLSMRSYCCISHESPSVISALGRALSETPGAKSSPLQFSSGRLPGIFPVYKPRGAGSSPVVQKLRGILAGIDGEKRAGARSRKRRLRIGHGRCLLPTVLILTHFSSELITYQAERWTAMRKVSSLLQRDVRQQSNCKNF